MHQIYPDGNGLSTGDNGLIGILQRFLVGDLHFHLFTSPTSPVDETILLAGLTEVTAAGYTLQTVLATAFTLVGLASHNGSVMAAPIGFGTNTSGAPVSVYGYYVTDTTDSVLLAISNFDSAPIVVPNGGAWPVVTPAFGDFSQYIS
jgi:hypothetical protein